MKGELHIVVLAAGQGKRMRSERPKVLLPLARRPLLDHVLRVARELAPTGLHIVYGYGAELLRSAFADHPDLNWVLQENQLGTGHAVLSALPQIDAGARVLVMLGDAPLVTAATLRRVVKDADTGLAVLTANFPDPAGYGRIVRATTGTFERIVEDRDASVEERAINEINSGVMAASADALTKWLTQVHNDNAQGEIYLTDIVAIARAAGVTVTATQTSDHVEVLGANDRWELAQLERIYQRRCAQALCRAGAMLLDPSRVDVRGTVEVDEGVEIDVNTVFEGHNVLSAGVTIGAHCVLRDCRLGPNTRVQPHCILDGVQTVGDCDIGPFARLRPGTRLAAGVRIGNFVETKNVELGEHSKANHLTYLGDASIGSGVNIGAGTITCNYDGINKHRTVIGDGAFIGSNAQLVAPVEIGAGATIGAGSTITRSAPAAKLTLSRAPQITLDQWQKPTKEKDS